MDEPLFGETLRTAIRADQARARRRERLLAAYRHAERRALRRFIAYMAAPRSAVWFGLTEDAELLSLHLARAISPGIGSDVLVHRAARVAAGLER